MTSNSTFYNIWGPTCTHFYGSQITSPTSCGNFGCNYNFETGQNDPCVWYNCTNIDYQGTLIDL